MSETTTAPQDSAAAIEEALRQDTLCAAFQVTAAANADRPALRVFGSDTALTWRDFAARVQSVATGLAALGVTSDDTVGLMLDSRDEFHLADTAVLHLGALPFSIYNSNPAEKIVPLLENSNARILIAEAHYAPVLAAIAKDMPQIERIVVVADEAGAGDMTFAELEALPAPASFDFEATWRSVTPDTLAMLIYTSGTTGEPKGAEWNHRSLMTNLRGHHQIIPVSPQGRMVSYLPMAHLAERFFSHYGTLVFGWTVTSLPDAKQLNAALAEVHPTRFFGVPRIYEKLAEAARRIAKEDETTHAALEAVAADGAGGPDALPEARKALAPVRAALGLDAAEYAGSSAAPARFDLLHLFNALGLTIVENWGMSETGMTLVNPPHRVKLGTVGIPTPGVEAKLADDGELLVRGPIFVGYRNDPEKTREALDEEGWMHSGDVATVDEDGYYKIVDRKKEIIINSAGKNMSPAYIENVIKAQTPLISSAVAIGDRRKYNTALIVLDEESLQRFAAEHGLQGSHQELSGAPEVRAEVARAIETANAGLARVEQIKTHLVMDRPWVPGTEEITATMKLRRRAINTKYALEIESLYEAGPPAR
jgi:long-subunit acyl-CoA synthetase (AMP-forming)